MQILSKHITQSGGLSFVWEDHNGYQVAGFTEIQVRQFLRENITIKQEGNIVWVRHRNAFGGISHRQLTYQECLEKELKRPAFCEKILSTNTIIK